MLHFLSVNLSLRTLKKVRQSGGNVVFFGDYFQRRTDPWQDSVSVRFLEKKWWEEEHHHSQALNSHLSDEMKLVKSPPAPAAELPECSAAAAGQADCWRIHFLLLLLSSGNRKRALNALLIPDWSFSSPLLCEVPKKPPIKTNLPPSFPIMPLCFWAPVFLRSAASGQPGIQQTTQRRKSTDSSSSVSELCSWHCLPLTPQKATRWKNAKKSKNTHTPPPASASSFAANKQDEQSHSDAEKWNHIKHRC